MTETVPQLTIETAAVTDRGLSEKRPLNEDSFLADAQRRIFAVADGVGGAQAGEVASQTAIEVLDEAFRHQADGVDVEDLMEIAIQRANTSIHRMAREHAKFSSMATTIVALHLEAQTATIGHVGDSRLYRLAPNGSLHRETADHSVVEEEVRAGRMTPDQAATHPSRNVISRALGVEETVEVDLKTIEVEDGTSFLLCSDGITRHIPDDEIGKLLSGSENPRAICDELKRRCYERGAEDNLTAIMVRLHSGADGGVVDQDDERTVIMERPAGQSLQTGRPGNDKQSVSAAPPFDNIQAKSQVGALATRTIAKTPPDQRPKEPAIASSPVSTEPPLRARGSGKALKVLSALFVILLIGTAFYLGAKFEKRRLVSVITSRQPDPIPSATPENAILKFEREQSIVDLDPSQWLSGPMSESVGHQGIDSPLSSSDPAFLYLYGRACLLSGDYEQASKAFEKVILIVQQKGDGTIPLRVEARLGLAAALIKQDRPPDHQRALAALEDVVHKKSSLPSQ